MGAAQERVGHGDVKGALLVAAGDGPVAGVVEAVRGYASVDESVRGAADPVVDVLLGQVDIYLGGVALEREEADLVVASAGDVVLLV